MRKPGLVVIKPAFFEERGFGKIANPECMCLPKYWGFICRKGVVVKIWDDSENSGVNAGKVGRVQRMDSFCMGEDVYIKLANRKEVCVSVLSIDPTSLLEYLWFKYCEKK